MCHSGFFFGTDFFQNENFRFIFKRDLKKGHDKKLILKETDSKTKTLN